MFTYLLNLKIKSYLFCTANRKVIPNARQGLISKVLSKSYIKIRFNSHCNYTIKNNMNVCDSINQINSLIQTDPRQVYVKKRDD